MWLVGLASYSFVVLEDSGGNGCACHVLSVFLYRFKCVNIGVFFEFMICNGTRI